MFSGRMAGLALSAAAAAACVSIDARGAIIKAANSGATSTSAQPATSTSGQRQILAKFDPYMIDEFQLDVFYTAARFQFAEIHGINGYVIQSYDIQYAGVTGAETGRINDIRGYFDYYGEGGPLTSLFGPPTPPGFANIFEILFNDINPTIEGKIGIEAGDYHDFLEGFDPQTGQGTTASGPDQIQSSFVIIPADPIGPGGPGGGGTAVPLPGALAMGLVAGVGVLGNAVRKRRKA